ncbi:MAG: Flp pilus assembly protein CpaB, partial [Lachnospiraceae bacterium]|nr:Flp pilus assembly protein CpaB [Lachnospiraceae bacterium]
MKIFKNRMVLGITCIVISLIICFALTPLINMGLSKKTTVVRMKQNVLEGEQLTRNMLEEVEVGNYNMPENVFHSMSEVEGLYLTAYVCAGDYLFPAKVSAEAGLENTYLYHLNGEKQAMSITIDKFAQGLSGKLKSGDIVSVIAPDYQGSRETVIPQELRYVEVIAVTANSGYDANLEDGRDKDEKELPSTVTLLVKPEQSEILAGLEAEGTIHLSLVYRGTKENATKFIEAQDLIL